MSKNSRLTGAGGNIFAADNIVSGDNEVYYQKVKIVLGDDGTDEGTLSSALSLKVQSIPIELGLPTQKFLTLSGDGLGAYNLNGNYAAAAVDAYYQTDSVYDITTVLISISDDTKFLQSDYGGITAGTITNGVKFFIKPNSLSEIPLLSGVAFTKNYEWLSITEHNFLTSFDGTPQTLTVAFRLIEDYGKPIRMSVGDQFIIRLNDDFTGLVSHTFGIRGIKY